MKPLAIVTALLGVLVLGVLTPVASADPVPAGFDYIRTTGGGGGGGTRFDFGAPLGMVNLTGNPTPPFPYDTVIRRLEEANVDAPSQGGPSQDTIAAQIVGLNLVSVNPVNVGGSFFDVFVDLDPGIASLGTLTIRHDWEDNAGPLFSTFLGPKNASGTFDSFFDVWFDVRLEDINNILPDVNLGPMHAEFSSVDGKWAHGPAGYDFLPDQIAEQHGAGAHRGDVTSPAPGAAVLGLIGMSLIGWLKRRAA